MKKDIISIEDFSRVEIEHILETADLREDIFSKYASAFNGKIVATFFFQPSSRTKLSFQSSFIRLGGQYIGFSDIEESRSGSSYKEKMSDLSKILDAYCDVAVLRHFDQYAIQKLAQDTLVPIISAGNGDDEHPTQALTDLYTIRHEFGCLDNKNVLIIGTIPSRSMNSLILALSMWNNNSIHIVGNNNCIPPKLMDKNIKLYSSIKEYADKSHLETDTHIIYVTEIKPSYEKKYEYILHHEDLNMFPNAIVLCPLPRTAELPFLIDSHHAARYFYQAKNGVFVRAALYLHIFQII